MDKQKYQKLIDDLISKSEKGEIPTAIAWQCIHAIMELCSNVT